MKKENSQKKDSVQLGPDTVRPISGAAKGCKAGHSRYSYVLPVELAKQIKAIASYCGKPDVAIVIDALNLYVQLVEKKNPGITSDRTLVL